MRFAIPILLAVSAAAQVRLEESLATEIEAAATDESRAAILAAHPDAVPEILKLVTAHAAAAFAKFNYDEALKGYRAELAIGVFTKEDAEIARGWRFIGSCLYRKNQFAESLDLEQKALDLATKAGDKPTAAEALLGLTAVYMQLGRLDDAERVVRQGIALNQELGNQRRAAGMKVNLGTLLGEKGDQEAKAEYMREAIQESEAGDFKDILAAAVNNLGVVYHDQGEFERSLQYLHRALDLIANDKVPNTSRMSTLHSNMAVMLAALGRTKEAFDEYDKAAELAGEDQAMAMHIRFNRGDLYRDSGNLAKAVSEYKAASDYYATSPQRTDALRTDAGYAQGLLDAGQPQAAMEVAAKAAAEARTIGDPDLIRMCLSHLGDAYMALGKREEARAAFVEAIGALESIKLSGSQDEQGSFFHEKAAPYHGMVRLLVEDGKIFEALQYAERAKARLLLDVLRGGRAEIVRAMTDAEKQKERDLAAAVAALDSQLARQKGSTPAELLDRRTRTAAEIDQFHAALYLAHPELRTTRAEFPPIQLEQLEALLPDADTALLEFTVTAKTVYLFAIARNAAGKPHVECYQLRNSAGLTTEIERYREQLEARDIGFRTAAQALYTRLLGPASALLRQKKRLILVPDGSLWNLPFQTLVSPQGRFVIEDAAVFYGPSLTALRAMLALPRTHTDSSRTLLALGGPSTVGQQALPEAAGEVRQIGDVYGARAGTVLTGDEAQKQRWKSLAPNYRILHLATHGVLNGNNPLYSYLVMSRAPGARDDSMLSAREILGMNLQADMTVLSACETARGKYRFGEGLIGMSWAFLVAGTPTTVVSQWKVDSDSTSKLMVSFHRNLKVTGEGAMHGRAEALRTAVLQLLGTPEYRHPFYWAGFVIVGNGY